MSHVALIRAGMNISLLKADSKSERSLKKNTPQTKRLFRIRKERKTCIKRGKMTLFRETARQNKI